MAESSWSGRNVLVTGAGGFIGSHLLEQLVEEGARVRALVRYASHGRWGWLEDSPCRDDVEVLQGDVRDADTLGRTMAGVDTVFHLAALIGIPYSYVTPIGYLRTNAEGTLNVLQAARAAGVGLVAHASTSEVYGTARYTPIDEAHPLQAQSPYAASKIAADKLAESFHSTYGLPVVTVRPFNAYGPRQSARAVVPAIVAQALAGGPVRMGALTPRRDFTHVDDTARGFLAAAAAPGAVGQVLNLGTGDECSIEELVRAVGDVMDEELVIQHDPARDRPAASEVDRLCCDNRRMRELTGWQPSVPLREGLRSTIEFMRDHLDHYRPAQYQV